MTFDLEAARAGIAHYRIENTSNVDTESAIKELVDQANLAEDALAEIGRLRPFEMAARDLDSDLTKIAGERDDQAARIKSLKKEIRRLKHESKVEQEFTNSYIRRLHDAEARIEKLESSLDEAEALTKKNADLMNGYLARIAELEEWLKKERSARLLEQTGSILLAYLKENEIDFDIFFDGKALEQLQAEGKIGSSDHSSDVTKKVWQITEERKAALSAMSSLRTDVDCPQCDAWLHFSDIAEHAPVLRAMLTEAA